MTALMWILSTVIILLLFTIIYILLNINKGVKTPSGIEIENKILLMRAELSDLLKGNRDDIDRTKDIISTNTIETMKLIKDLNQTINSLTVEQKSAVELSKDLKYFFDRPKLRGNFGEYILEDLVSSFIPKGMYKAQYKMTTGVIIDLAVFYRDFLIPVDSKFPVEDYSKYINETDEKIRSGLFTAFIDKVKSIGKDISSKYIQPENGTSDFAIMFIPSDAIYFECIQSSNSDNKKNDIFEYMSKIKVMLAGPSTLNAFLMVIMMGMKQYQFVKNTKEIQENADKLKKAVENFMSKYEDTGKFIEKLEESYRISQTHINTVVKVSDKITQIRIGEEEVTDEKNSRI